MSFSKTAKANLLAVADTFAKATGLSIATVSRKFYGHRNFFEGLRAGKCSINLDKVDDVLETFRAQWPEGAQWPKTAPCHMGRKPGKTVHDPGAKENRIAHKRGHDARARPG